MEGEVPQKVDNSTREKDKFKVKRILRSPSVSGRQIAEALNDYFKKYCVTDAVVVKKTAAENILEIFDGGLF